MLDIWTGGEYKATPHRVKNISGRDRLSIPFFFDPHFESIIQPMRPEMVNPDSPWARPFPYGRYIYNKVSLSRPLCDI
jgi:isopenicillin N synthase-like dioxygenase